MVLGGWGVSQPKPFIYTLPAEIRLLLMRRERWILGNCEVSLTLIIHWLGPPLFFPWYSEATLAIWSKGLPKGSYQENTPSPAAVRLELAIYR